MASVRKKTKFKEDKNMISELDQQIRSYVQEYVTNRDSELLDQAIADINKHHQNQTRKSGQPVIIHTLRVANYICRAGLDAPTVVAALLHDIIEDTKITHKDIQKVMETGTQILSRDLPKSKILKDQILRQVTI